ncbi:MAG: hypothetical protein QXE43_00490 [Candidatus Aenigmatarchaeota archaeon]
MKIQSALEYLLISSFVLTIIIIGFSFAFRESMHQIFQINIRQIEVNIQRIIYYSELVFSQDAPAKYTLKLNFPIETKIYNISNVLIAEYSNNKISYPLNFNIFVNESFFGFISIEIKNEGNYVKIKKI